MQIVTAGAWYQTRKIDDDITHIEEPYIKPFYRCNIWHVRGREHDMLVDSGMGVVSLRAQVEQLAKRPIVAVASHTHFDHIGCHHEFAERAVHAAEAELIASPGRRETLVEPYVTDDIFTALPPNNYSSQAYAVRPAPATRILDDGDLIDLGNRCFEVLHTPGHSPGSIMLFERDSGVLLSGDTIYDGPLIEDAYHSNIDRYIASMQRILDLPVRVVHGGHFQSFDGKRYRELIRAFLDEKGC